MKKTTALRVVAPAPLPSDKLAFNVRHLNRPQSSAIVVSDDDPLTALTKVLDHDVSQLFEPVVNWTDRDKCVALDLDRPDGAAPALPEDLTKLIRPGLPSPAAAWVTHGGGLRFVFVANEKHPATAAAGMFMYFANIGRFAQFSVEAKTDTRHPAGMRGTERCSSVYRFPPSSDLVFPSERTERDVEELEVKAWLEERGLVVGRNPVGLCPWCGHRGGTCNHPVAVTSTGVRCYRCGRRSSFAALVDNRKSVTGMQEAARNLVHLAHQRLVMLAERPSMPESLVAPTWQAVLVEANLDRLQHDPDGMWRAAVEAACRQYPDIVRGASHCWLSARTLEPRKVTERTVRELPAVRSGTAIDHALSSEHLPGFVPLDPRPASYVISPVAQTSDGILIRQPRGTDEPPPVELGPNRPSPEDVQRAFVYLEQKRLPGLPRGYLQGLVLAGLVAQRAHGTPPIIIATGISGSAKTTTARCAAAALGTKLGEVLLEEPRAFTRKVGLQL